MINQPAEQRANPKVIKFDSKNDIKLRYRAHHSHDLAKQLRDAGLHFIKVSPIERDAALAAKLHIGKKSKSHQILISLTGVANNDKALIDEFLAFFLTRDDYVITNHGHYNTGKSPTYYFIADPVNPKVEDKEMKAELLGDE